MDFFRWKRTLIRALVPALLCAVLAAWGVYVLTADERPTYRSFALLNTGIMSNRDIGGKFNRDLVINELENLTNLAKSFEVREELSVQLLAHFLSLGEPQSHSISARAYNDFWEELDPGIVERHAQKGDEERIYASLVSERDSLRRFGEIMAEHPLIELLYGDNSLVGAEQLATVKVNRKGMSDLLEISYATVDAAWCKLTLDRHIAIFLQQHKSVKDERRSGALAYFREATAESRLKLNAAEEKLRRFATENRIINYYEQTRFISSLKNQVDHRFTEEAMKKAAADSTLETLNEKLAKRLNLVRLNNVIDDKRRELGNLSRQQVRLEIMGIDSVAEASTDLEAVEARMQALRREISGDVSELQEVHNGPEGLELGRLITEWLNATLMVEEARGRLDVLDRRKIDFRRIYTRLANQGAELKKIERENRILEEDYLENLRNLNEALQKEYSQGATAELRLVDEPVLPAKPEKSKRIVFIIAGGLAGGMFPLLLALALELLSGALLSFAEAERRSGLTVVGGVARWSTLRRLVHKSSRDALRATTADLLWQGMRARGKPTTTSRNGPRIIAVASFQPSAGKSFAIDVLAERLAGRGIRVCVVADRPAVTAVYPGVSHVVVDGVAAMSPSAVPRKVAGQSKKQWQHYEVVLWELPALATGRLPVDIARQASDALLVHPAAAGWSDGHKNALGQLQDALGQEPKLIVNGLALDILLHEWGASLKQLRSWSYEQKVMPVVGAAQATVPPVLPPTPTPPTERAVPVELTQVDPVVQALPVHDALPEWPNAEPQTPPPFPAEAAQQAYQAAIAQDLDAEVTPTPAQAAIDDDWEASLLGWDTTETTSPPSAGALDLDPSPPARGVDWENALKHE